MSKSEQDVIKDMKAHDLMLQTVNNRVWRDTWKDLSNTKTAHYLGAYSCACQKEES